MRRIAVVALLVEAAAACLPAVGCSGGEGAESGMRFVVVPEILTVADEPLLAGVAWWPFEPDVEGLDVTDATEVPGVGAEFSWRHSSAPPTEARYLEGGEEVAVGLLVAFVDGDGDGGSSLVHDGEGWEVSGLSPEGDDVLAGIATDHVVAFASTDLAEDGDAAGLVGWPLRRGLRVMRVDRAQGVDRLVPPTDRERVPIYLVGSGGAGEGLCCEPLRDPRACGRPGILCPDFRNR